jgi:hypothetical protein
VRCSLDHPSALPSSQWRFRDGSDGAEDVRSFAGRFSNKPQYFESSASIALALRFGFILREQPAGAIVAGDQREPACGN